MTDAERMERAGEYVLGMMDEAERERAERDLETDAAFCDCVARLAVALASLDETARPAEPPDALWRSIEARIVDLPQMRGAAARGDEAARKIADIVEEKKKRETRSAAHSVGGWRGGLIAASLLVACGIGFLGGRLTAPVPEPLVVVVLTDEDSVPGAIMEAYGGDRVRVIPLVDFAVPEGKILQAWTLWDREVGPVSLGTFSRAREITLEAPPGLPSPAPDQLYEITLEDAPGSTAGRPLGPILVKGLAVRPPR